MSETPESEETSELRTYVEIPDGAVLLGCVEAVSYLDPEGDTCYGFRWPAEMSYSQILGLLELVKVQVSAHYLSQYPPDIED